MYKILGRLGGGGEAGWGSDWRRLIANFDQLSGSVHAEWLEQPLKNVLDYPKHKADL